MEKKAPDWEKIELDYRAGVKTLRQIAEEHGISHGAINKRAKRDGWSRDLSSKIAAKVDELVSKSAVSSEVSKETKVSEREIVDANAQAIVSVRMGQRRDISRAQRVLANLWTEIEHQSGVEAAEMLANLGEIVRAEDDAGRDKLNDLYRKIISLPERVKTGKDLVDSLVKLQTREDLAFGLVTPGLPDDSATGKSRVMIEFVRPPRREEDDE